MSVFERCARVALHAYPEPFRRERGPEILGTLLELQDAGARRPILELIALVLGGLQARRNLAVTGGRAHLWRTTAGWIASWMAPIVAGFLSLLAADFFLEVHWRCRPPQCTYSYDPTGDVVRLAAFALVAVATLLAAPLWRRASVLLSVVLLVELVAWRYRVMTGAALILTVSLAAGGPLRRRDVARHAVIVSAAIACAVLVPPLGLLVVAFLPLVLLVALLASYVDARAAITALALTVALAPLFSFYLRSWAGPRALLTASALVALTCIALAMRSRRSTPT